MRRAPWLLAAVVAALGLSAQGQFGGTADPPVPSVAVRVRVASEAARGEELAYRILADNSSAADAHHVTVKVTLPKNARFVRARPDASDPGPAVAVWRLGTLKSGERREITLTLLPDGDSDVDLCARVQFEHGQCVRTKISRPGLQFRRTGPASGVKNDLLQIRLEVTNTGKAPARDVTLVETLPKGLDLVQLKGEPPPTGNAPTYTWKVGDLPAGATRVIRYQVLAESEGEHTITGEARSGTLRREATTTIKVGEPGMKVTVTGPEKAEALKAVTYRIVVTNPGSVPLGSVRLETDLPAQVAFEGATGGGSLKGKSVSWSLGNIAPGSSREVTLSVRATEAGELKSVFTATADRGLREQGKAVTVFTGG
jgi:hypothetical protein